MNRVLKTVLPTILVLVAAEVTIRIVEYATRDKDRPVAQDEGDWWDTSPELGWVAKPDFSGDVYGKPRTFDANGYISVDSDQINGSKPRILLIGDSTTFGYGVDADSCFAEILDRMLPDYDVINLGLPGYTSYQGMVTLRRHIEALDPEIVIASFNFNDRRFVLHEKDKDGPQQFQRIYNANKPLARAARSIAIVRLAMKIRKKIAGEGPRNYAIDEVFPRVSPIEYKQNLVEIVFSGRKIGAKVILLNLPDNPNLTAPVYTAIDKFRDGDARTAANLLAVVASSQTAYTTVAKKMLANLLKRGGRGADAEAVGVIVEPVLSIHGGKPIYLDADYSKVMMETAASEGATFIDGGDPLRREPDYFVDFVHITPAAHALVARMLADEINGNSGMDKSGEMTNN